MMTRKEPLRFIIWASDFDENVGGIIALHALCHRLRELGHEAKIWPGGDPRHGTVLKTARELSRRLAGKKFDLGPFANELASKEDIAGAIVIYPEIVPGNPLRANKVVRWHLHKKGFWRTGINFGANEVDIYYQSFFSPDEMIIREEDTLRIRWIRDDIYADRQLGNRFGACRMIRKGNKSLPNDQKFYKSLMPLDGKSHVEIAEAFNQHEIFICHDPYTMFGFYAALCGCLPVILPIEGVSENEWRADEEDRWGLAYGFERIEWAKKTRSLMIEKFQKEQLSEKESLMRFVDRMGQEW